MVGKPGFWKRLWCNDCFYYDRIIRYDTELDLVLKQCNLTPPPSVGPQTQEASCGLAVVNYGEAEMCAGMPDTALADVGVVFTSDRPAEYTSNSPMRIRV